MSIHKPTVVELHTAGLIGTAAAARAWLLAEYQMRMKRGQKCYVSCSRIAKGLGVDPATVRQALTRWPAVTRTGENGKRRRAWTVTFCHAPQEQPQPGPTPGPATPRALQNVTPERYKTSRPSVTECHAPQQKKKYKNYNRENPRTRETAKPPANVGTPSQGGGSVNKFNERFFSELAQRKAANFEPMPDTPTRPPDPGEVEKNYQSIMAKSEDRRGAFVYACGTGCPERHRVLDRALKNIPWPQYAAAAAYTATWRLANPKRHRQAAGVFVNRLKMQMAKNRPAATSASG